MMANAVLFGAGIIVVLMASSADPVIWIPVVVALSIVLAIPIGWEIAPRLRLRNRPQLCLQPATLRTQHYAVRRD
jgi:hypothetical protein